MAKEMFGDKPEPGRAAHAGRLSFTLTSTAIVFMLFIACGGHWYGVDGRLHVESALHPSWLGLFAFLLLVGGFASAVVALIRSEPNTSTLAALIVSLLTLVMGGAFLALSLMNVLP